LIYLVDTDTLIYLIKNRPPSVAARVNALPVTDQLRMSFVSYAELLKGAEKSNRKAEVLRQIDALTRQIPVVFDTSPALCGHYATQFTRLKTAGTPIGANDLWIACHALALAATLVTNNTREFERVTGLHLENWVG
jgi:tRNA(fMet)-specific endonuclease VapC